ncbi:MAG: peptidase S11 [Micavibrio sp.]|nr:MAG: peptidase S11 [Micavibrio sp.]
MTRMTYLCIQSLEIKHKILLSLTFALIFSVAMMALAQSGYAKSNPRYASIVMDADTGQILSQSNADKKLHPASLTKAMTLLMAFEALERGELSLKSRVRISRHATKMIPSKLDLPEGSTIRVEDAIYALVTKSANDVAVALAEKLGGSERNFAKMMTQRAHEIGMDQTTFRNASGLHDPRQISTARDMAKLARMMISRYPKYYAYFSTKKFTYAGKTYRNHNRLMDTYKGMDGMKTGYIQASGFNLVASAVRNNRRIIGVVFGGRTSKSRNRHMAQLLDRGFSKLGNVRIAKARVPLPPRKPGILVALQSLNDMNPSAGGPGGQQNTKWAQLNPTLQTNMFSRMIGEGDSDPAVSKRIETGLIAIAAHKGEAIPEKYMQIASLNRDKESQKKIIPVASKEVPYRRPQVNKLPTNEPWSIQVGAFTSRDKTDRMISNALKALPARLSGANPLIAPLNTEAGWLFRGRLSGYTRTQAFEACSYLKDCLPVPPR